MNEEEIKKIREILYYEKYYIDIEYDECEELRKLVEKLIKENKELKRKFQCNKIYINDSWINGETINVNKLDYDNVVIKNVNIKIENNNVYIRGSE